MLQQKAHSYSPFSAFNTFLGKLKFLFICSVYQIQIGFSGGGGGGVVCVCVYIEKLNIMRALNITILLLFGL